MELTVMDRIVLMELLPEQGSFAALREIRELREALAFSEEEAVDLEVAQEDGIVRWNSEKEGDPKTVVISEYLLGRILTKARQLDRQESIPAPFYDMLVRLGYEG